MSDRPRVYEADDEARAEREPVDDPLGEPSWEDVHACSYCGELAVRPGARCAACGTKQ